jgi:hypothetical protein
VGFFLLHKSPRTARIEEMKMNQRTREIEMEELLCSAHAIALREGKDTAWKRFAASIAKLGIGSVTARVYRILPSDIEEQHFD